MKVENFCLITLEKALNDDPVATVKVIIFIYLFNINLLFVILLTSERAQIYT